MLFKNVLNFYVKNDKIYLKIVKNFQRSKNVIEKFKIYDFSNQKLTGSTVLGEFEGQRITVSQMLTAAENCTKYIKEHFNVNQKAYSMTLIVMKILKLRLINQSTDKPTAEQLKCVVDVFHEIADMHAPSDISKQENEKIVFELKMIIDFWDKYQKEQPK